MKTSQKDILQGVVYRDLLCGSFSARLIRVVLANVFIEI